MCVFSQFTKDSNEGINDTKLNKASATSDDVAKEETVSNTDTEKVGASSSD
ncbi:hypothetical protein HI030_01830 [Staphylococcus haemolyticus]|nr:hypothetical protein HI030_01830 [Staphylococcus haemolyticus]